MRNCFHIISRRSIKYLEVLGKSLKPPALENTDMKSFQLLMKGSGSARETFWEK